ncbi:MAG: hypothetical protein HYT79_08515 [Elusimicrobia bacterium]|nr:hypothetical protein [Elusimicrobiota bacterium]
MINGRRLLGAALCAAFCSSCVATREDMAGLEVQVARLEKTIGSVEKKQAELTQRLDEIKRPVESLNSNLNDTQNLLNNFNPKFEELRALIEAMRKEFAQRVLDLAKQINELDQSIEAKIASLKKAAPATGAKTKAKANDKKAKPANGKTAAVEEEEEDESLDAPLRTFQAAYKDFLAKRWDLADSGFETYLKAYPEGSLADKSLYYRALALKEKKNGAGAHEALDKLLARFPKSPVSRAGMLEKAKLYLDESKTGEAEGMLEYLIITHQGTKEAEEAKDLLKNIPHGKK